MRSFFAALTILGVGCVCQPAPMAAADHTDIAGVWRLATAGTAPVEGRPVTAGRLTIQYRHKNIELSESLTFPDGDRSVERNWKIDSHYHPVVGDGSGQVLAKWEGLTLVADHENNGSHENFRLQLSPDGHVLTETIRRPDGTSRILVWRR